MSVLRLLLSHLTGTSRLVQTHPKRRVRCRGGLWPPLSRWFAEDRALIEPPYSSAIRLFSAANEHMLFDARLTPLGQFWNSGGLPIIVDDVLIGAIGVGVWRW